MIEEFISAFWPGAWRLVNEDVMFAVPCCLWASDAWVQVLRQRSLWGLYFMAGSGSREKLVKQ